MEKQMNIEVVAKQDGIVIGKLAEEEWSGAYLSSQFIDRLAEVHGAAQTRLAALSSTEVPDAVRNLLGILTKMFSVYGTAVQPERDAHHEAHTKEAWDALMQAKSILDGMPKR
jgi:hypothetical protein